MRARRDDQGTVLLLTVGLCAVLLLLVAVVVDVSAVVLAQRALAAAADGAALAAAQQADRDSVVRDGLAERVPLDPDGVAQAVARYQQQARGEQPGLELTGVVDADDPGTAVVQAARRVPLPLVGWLRVGHVDLRATARAQAAVQP